MPALVLAAAGLYSLRQDDALARHQAVEQAERIAGDVSRRMIPDALRFDMPEAATLGRTASIPIVETLRKLQNSPLIGAAVLTDPEGKVIYPPERGPLPSPAPLDEGELSPAQQDEWLALEAAWQKDSPSAGRVLSTFLALHPPDRFAMVARFRVAMVLVRTNRSAEATALLQAVRDMPEELMAESGVPLRWLAEWQLALHLPESERSRHLHGLASRLVMDPSPLANRLLSDLVPLHSEMKIWETAITDQSRALDLSSFLQSGPAPGVIDFLDRPHLLVTRPVDGGTWHVAVPLGELSNALRLRDREMVRPGDFAIAISSSGQPLLDPPKGGVMLTRAAMNQLPLTVEVYLKDPAAFDAQRRARTRRFAALIAASAGAVVVGFVAAWRAFRRQQQLSEMKSNFVSSVTHELRAPIASVRLMAEELEHGSAPSAEKTRQYLQFIGQECRRLSAVIENVLDFSRREQGRERFEFEPTNMTRLVEETVAVMRAHGSDRHISLVATMDGEPRPMEADGRAVQRLLVNLIDNALKHAPDGSVVTVGLEFAPGVVTLWVEDHGPGIPSDEHERIFDKFYRVGSELRRETPGVGLGLSIVKHLAEAHGGRVKVCSHVGKGSRFTVEFPTPSAQSVPSPESPLPA